MKYSASLDKLAKIITVVVSLLFASAIILCVSLYLTDRDISLLIAPILLSLIYLFVLFFKPAGYRISDRTVFINRIVGEKKILFSSIEHISTIRKKEVKGTIRTFGVGGLFGYFGEFSNSKFGRMTWYVTHMDRLILITTTDKRHFIISPDKQDEFIRNFTEINRWD
ncbi:MAG: PH domain-containing protein [Chitinophagaceae bacterium]|jgi:hypothetical protein|nr:PH domain-containing protein [Chitinophagaceae bacterium]